MVNVQWLPHLPKEVLSETRANQFDAYLIALEGWRRGLTLKFYSDKVTKKGLHSPGLLFSLSSENETHTFYKARGDRVKGKAFSIGSNKFATKQWLRDQGIPVVEGEKFTKDVTDEEIIKYAKKIGFPVVLKPVVGAQGKGVIANIDNEDFLRKSLSYVRNELKVSEIILEKYFEGKEYRVYVIEDEVIAVINRVPANIIGDGIHTVKQLMTLKNKERKKNPRLASCLIKIDFEVKNNLDKIGLNLNSIPKKGQRIFLREKSNISTGGDSIELTDEFPEEIKQIAINTLKTIPEFPHGGVDIIYNPEKPMDEAAVVIELSPTPQIGSLVFPMEGIGRDVPSAIIDYYFPNTKGQRNTNPNFYFDFKGVLEPLLSKSASEITVTPVPTCPFFAKKYTIKGKVQGVGYRKWIRKKALESDLYGFAKNLSNGDVVIIVAGDKEKVNHFKNICKMGPKKCKVTSVTENEWNKPVKIGFEIIEEVKPNPSNQNSTKNESKKKNNNGLYADFKNLVKKFINFG